ncbi:MAG: cation:proton antiporter [Aquificae bacterium]|nr:cation:proton antiporter [Aquificota bacterium]
MAAQGGEVAHAAAEIFLALFLILVFARIFAELFAYLRLPPVLGEVTAGIVLGPSLLGWVEPNEIIRILAEIGIVLLLFEVGLETDVEKLKKEGLNAFLVAVVGAFVPFALGFAVAHYLLDLPLLTSLFVGGTLTATSIGITLRVFKDLGKEKTKEAQIVVGAAVLDDIIGVVLLVILADFAFRGEIKLENFLKIVGLLAVYFMVAPVLAKLLSKVVHHYDRRYRRVPGFIPTVIVSLILFFAYVAHLLGIPEIVGAFAAGVALSRRFFLPFGIVWKDKEEFVREVENQMRPLVYLFTPIFFVSVGLSMNLRVIDYSSPDFWLLTLLLFAVAVLGKVAGGFAMPKKSNFERLIVGVSMVPRGEVGLIFAELGRTAGVLSQKVFAPVVFIVFLTTLFAPLALKYLYRKWDQLKERKQTP